MILLPSLPLIVSEVKQLKSDMFEIKNGTQAGASGDERTWDEVVHCGKCNPCRALTILLLKVIY